MISERSPYFHHPRLGWIAALSSCQEDAPTIYRYCCSCCCCLLLSSPSPPTTMIIHAIQQHVVAVPAAGCGFWRTIPIIIVGAN